MDFVIIVLWSCFGLNFDRIKTSEFCKANAGILDTFIAYVHLHFHWILSIFLLSNLNMNCVWKIYYLSKVVDIVLMDYFCFNGFWKAPNLLAIASDWIYVGISGECGFLFVVETMFAWREECLAIEGEINANFHYWSNGRRKLKELKSRGNKRSDCITKTLPSPWNTSNPLFNSGITFNLYKKGSKCPH